MVMGQFVTTYRKDYLWPYVKTLGLRPEPEHIYSPEYRSQTCKCHCLPAVPPTSQQRTLIGPAALGDEEWSRLGPMGPLLEPKVFTAKVSSAPESEVSRFNQPNVFMAKLQEKYPFIYECLRTAPPDDLIARINKDRLSSSYQVDYCHKQEYPNAPYDELIRAAGVEGLAPCPEPTRLPGDICRPIQKMKVYKKCSAFTNEQFKTRGPGGRGSGGHVRDDSKQILGACKGGTFTVTPGYTEYMDTVSRLGTLIIRDGLHDPVRRSKKYIY
ncbi:uncharacterized protein LOC130895613 isoform X1 [Diorhabda carinulata]|uniref:uncharacterized protein LOC130895613 isoform X1 n=1 Tax=Diorhabda carinulata TaxID=1163345 RepID=UPI0025A0D2DF|nr:uncharacterized protein LOC130895613 isoform X1 [Diorhabda carinulata]